MNDDYIIKVTGNSDTMEKLMNSCGSIMFTDEKKCTNPDGIVILETKRGETAWADVSTLISD